MRQTVLPLSLVLVAIAGFAAWALVARPGAGDRAALPEKAVTALAPGHDTAAETWRLSSLPVVPPRRPAPTPRAVPEPSDAPAPDWSALRVEVAPIAPVSAGLATATAPAELEFAMSARERRALIASARDPESPPGPHGYRPGIAVVVPGGSTSGGVCRQVSGGRAGEATRGASSSG